MPQLSVLKTPSPLPAKANAGRVRVVVAKGSTFASKGPTHERTRPTGMKTTRTSMLSHGVRLTRTHNLTHAKVSRILPHKRHALHVAALQLSVGPNPTDNLARAGALIDEAASAGA